MSSASSKDKYASTSCPISQESSVGEERKCTWVLTHCPRSPTAAIKHTRKDGIPGKRTRAAIYFELSVFGGWWNFKYSQNYYFFFLSVKIIYSSWGFSGFLCSVFIGFFHWFWFLGLAVMVVSILFCDVALAGTDHAPRMAGYQLFATPPPRTSWVLRLQAACATVLSWFCFAVFSLTCFPSCFV